MHPVRPVPPAQYRLAQVAVWLAALLPPPPALAADGCPAAAKTRAPARAAAPVAAAAAATRAAPDTAAATQPGRRAKPARPAKVRGVPAEDLERDLWRHQSFG